MSLCKVLDRGHTTKSFVFAGHRFTKHLFFICFRYFVNKTHLVTFVNHATRSISKWIEMSDDTRKHQPMIRLWINHTCLWDGCANLVHKCNRFLFVWRLLFLQIVAECSCFLNVQEFWKTQHVFKNATVSYLFGACYFAFFMCIYLLPQCPEIARKWECRTS